jgi:hypothetical protein
MENKQFLKKSDLDSLIDIYIGDIIEELNSYALFQGFISNSDHSKVYVDGYFIIEEFEWGFSSIVGDEMTSPNETCFIKALTGTKYSNNDNLIGNTYNLNSIYELDEILYCYNEFKELLNSYKIPLIRDIDDLPKKQLSYDPELINQISNFTLAEASRIAANAPLKDQQGDFFSTSLAKHYREVLSECIKNQNQHSFHLITKQLWTERDFGQSSIQHPNSTILNVSSKVDSDFTIISKSEFLRWCKYMDIDTGLYSDQKIIDESIEALKIELNESEKEVSRLRDLFLSEPENISLKEISYPPELQLAIDAFEQLCLNQEKPPTNENIKEWLQMKSKERGITHKDGSTELKGFSDIKLKTIPSIIKSQ